MGGGSWNTRSYEHIAKRVVGKTTKEVFSNTDTDVDMKPIDVMRDARDSDAHPNSLGVMVFLDETGSMGRIPDYLVRTGLGPLMDTMTNEKTIKDVSLCFGAFGDHLSDRSPFQIGQFESEADKLNRWLTGIFLEGHGGGTMEESPLLAWLFAARHTSLDCFEKRGKKGVLFTISDEMCHTSISGEDQISIFGGSQASDITDIEALALAEQMYDVFHIHANDTGYHNRDEILSYWQRMLPERFIVVEKHEEIAETIAATTAILHGTSLADAVAGFNTDVAGRVSTALAKVSTGGAMTTDNPSGGIKPL